jgi:hypothetical protein
MRPASWQPAVEEFQERSSSAEDWRFFLFHQPMLKVQGTVSNLWTKLIIAVFGVLVLLPVEAALAVNCSDAPYNGVIDGNFVSAPDQIQIDRNCTIRNFPAPNLLDTNFSFYTQPGGTTERWLVVFDNVVHTGNMSCNNVAGHRIWFTNGSSTKIQEGCQNLLIPVEKIDKRNPAGQTTAAIGVPFTYRLTIPVLYDPAFGDVINSRIRNIGFSLWLVFREFSNVQKFSH